MPRVNAGAALALLVVAGYVGFEVYTLKRLGYRMEPLYIYDQFVTARYAARACGDVDLERLDKFDGNLSAVERRARKELAAADGGGRAEDIDAALASRRADAEAGVAALIGREGCDSIEVFKLKKGFENRARLNLG